MSPAPRQLLGGQILAGLALLGLGLLAGWMLRAPAAPAPSYLSQLTQDLGLRPEQVASADAILADFDRDLDALVSRHRESMQGEVASRLDQSELAILALLDEGQRDRYQELLAVEGH